MNFNYKLYFKYVFFNLPHLYLQHSYHGSKNISVVLSKSIFYYSSIHMRFSSVFFSSQLVDLFAYELPLSNSDISNLDGKNYNKLVLTNTSNSILVYNFHNLTFQERFFFLYRISRQLRYFHFKFYW